MANDDPILTLLRVQQALPALSHHGDEAGNDLQQDRAGLPHAQLYPRGEDLHQGAAEVHQGTVNPPVHRLIFSCCSVYDNELVSKLILLSHLYSLCIVFHDERNRTLFKNNMKS